MDIRQLNRKGAIEIMPIGKLDIDKAEAFENAFNDGALASEHKAIGVNLSKVDYIDSSGLGVLIKVLNSAKNEGKSMLLFGATPKIQNIFQLARLEKFFTFTTAAEFSAKYPSEGDEEMNSFIENL